VEIGSKKGKKRSSNIKGIASSPFCMICSEMLSNSSLEICPFRKRRWVRERRKLLSVSPFLSIISPLSSSTGASDKRESRENGLGPRFQD